MSWNSLDPHWTFFKWATLFLLIFGLFQTNIQNLLSRYNIWYLIQTLCPDSYLIWYVFQISRCPILKQQAGDQPLGVRLDHAPQELCSHYQRILWRSNPRWNRWSVLPDFAIKSSPIFPIVALKRVHSSFEWKSGHTVCDLHDYLILWLMFFHCSFYYWDPS